MYFIEMGSFMEMGAIPGKIMIHGVLSTKEEGHNLRFSFRNASYHISYSDQLLALSLKEVGGRSLVIICQMFEPIT